MPTIEKTIEVDLDDFTTQELRDELNWRGESDTDISEFDEDDLIEEIERRGYTVYDKLSDLQDELSNLYSTYMTMSPEFFDKELKRMFREKLDISVY